MHRVLINNYNATVPEDGLCYFVGDMGMGQYDKLKKVMDQLQGTKVAVIGNHDKNVNTLYRMGFDCVVHGLVLWIANEQVTVTHCPLRDTYREDTSKMPGDHPNWYKEKQHQQYCIPNWGQYHLSGHIHSPNRGQSKKILGRQMDIGVDANNFKPVNIKEIESWIARTRDIKYD